MAKIERSALMPYSNEQMFTLVNDIESYPDFMSGCTGARVLNRGEGWLEAELNLSRGGFSQSFITRNALFPPDKMTLNLISGPFKSFQGMWYFEALNDQACKVTFSLDYEFSNKLLGFAVGKLFKQIASDQVTSVRERADKVYGHE